MTLSYDQEKLIARVEYGRHILADDVRALIAIIRELERENEATNKTYHDCGFNAGVIITEKRFEARIAELEAELAKAREDNATMINDSVIALAWKDAFERERVARDQEIRKLGEALEPFAQYADKDGLKYYRDIDVTTTGFRAGDFRRAREAFRSHAPAPKE